MIQKYIFTIMHMIFDILENKNSIFQKRSIHSIWKIILRKMLDLNLLYLINLWRKYISQYTLTTKFETFVDQTSFKNDKN